MNTINAELSPVIRRMNARLLGITSGLLAGGTLFLATIILVIKGGPNMGQHLSLLSHYFPGYSVSVLGSFVGFVYAFVVGYGIGAAIATIYSHAAAEQR